MKLRICSLIATVCALAALAVVASSPVKSRTSNVALLAAAGTVWAGLLGLCWRVRPARLAIATAPALLGAWCLLPGRIDRAALGDDYLRRVRAMEEVRYVWGGESRRGIDCSGLPRRALRDGLLAHGLRRGSGEALRAFAEQWWFDASARALGGGYRDYTRPLGFAGTIAEMDYSGLRPGDLAVTADGRHVLVFAGGELWTQADPGIGAVATLNGRNSNNGWFSQPVTTHRWRLLDE